MAADVSEIHAFAADLRQAPPKVIRRVPGVVKRGAQNIKTEMQRDMASSSSFKGITFSINYDVTMNGDGVEAEIGPDKGRSGGALANIAYFGGSRGGGGTVRSPDGALAAEVPRFERALGDLLEGLL